MNTISKWLTALALLSGPVVANAALTSVDGGLGVYDSTNNATWTSDANLFLTQADNYSGGADAFVAAIIANSGGVIHDTPNTYDPSGTYTLSASDFVTAYTNGPNGTFYAGTMTWWGAQAWVNYLNATNYGGSKQWSLPATYLNQNPGGYPPPQSSSQMAQLFYGGLGQVVSSSITTTHNGNYSLFSNVQQYVYWSDTEDPSPYLAWAFNTTQGAQFNYVKTAYGNALAVAPGQVNSPAALLAALLTEVTGVGPGTSLADKVKFAQTYYAVPDIQATCAVLTGFVNEVQAQDGKKIGQQLDAKLIADAQAIEAAIGCGSPPPD